MKVNSLLIEHYLLMVTDSEAAMLEDPAGDLVGHDDAIDAMGAAAREAGDDDLLRMAIDALIAAPADGQRGPFAGNVHVWPDHEFLALLMRAHRRLWPGKPLGDAGEAADIEFLPMTPQEWAAYTGRV